MQGTLKKLLEILPAPTSKLLIILILFLFTSVLEVIGIGVIGPFIALANDFSLISKNLFLSKLFSISGIQQEHQFVAFIGSLVMGAFIVKTLGAWFTQSYIVRFSDRQQRLLIVKMSREYLAASYIYHTKKNSSSIIGMIIEISNSFTNSILTPLLTTTANIFVSTSLFFLLCATSISVMVVLLAVLLPVFIFFNSFKDRINRWGKEVLRSKENIVRIINHAFGGIKETKIIGCESYFEEQIIAQAKLLEHSHGNFASFKILPRFVTECAMVLSIVAIISVSLLLGIGIDNITSVLGVYALASIRLLPAISNSIVGVNQLRNSSYTINQIYADLKELENFKEKQTLNQNQLNLPQLSKNSFEPDFSKENARAHLNFTKEISLNNLTYSYPGSSAHAVSELSLTIKKGESIAFIGKSGAGKTTLVDIILGLLIPQVGDIKVDGVSIYQNLRAWQNSIGYIPQTIFLTDETLERNIAFGVPDALVDREQLKMAIDAAQLTEVIEKLPHGLETVVGERGVLLSGGQRQRVGIARALYHEREILVLDEATAALDNETEKLVTDSIRDLMGRKTIIIIAHRLTTVKDCQQIYKLENGKIKNFGNYDEVILRGEQV
ncbi:ABC transporter ATP-binding protein [Altericista sp. CCNU0014]|uniref:ABC transporter ATP-binding protein n=1 Tax=Altericista sp. CCNU0014 TaxID=3082949 RepID=UPI00384F7A33